MKDKNVEGYVTIGFLLIPVTFLCGIAIFLTALFATGDFKPNRIDVCSVCRTHNFVDYYETYTFTRTHKYYCYTCGKEYNYCLMDNEVIE